MCFLKNVFSQKYLFLAGAKHAALQVGWSQGRHAKKCKKTLKKSQKYHLVASYQYKKYKELKMHKEQKTQKGQNMQKNNKRNAIVCQLLVLCTYLSYRLHILHGTSYELSQKIRGGGSIFGDW